MCLCDKMFLAGKSTASVLKKLEMSISPPGLVTLIDILVDTEATGREHTFKTDALCALVGPNCTAYPMTAILVLQPLLAERCKDLCQELLTGYVDRYRARDWWPLDGPSPANTVMGCTAIVEEFVFRHDVSVWFRRAMACSLQFRTLVYSLLSLPNHLGLKRDHARMVVAALTPAIRTPPGHAEMIPLLLPDSDP